MDQYKHMRWRACKESSAPAIRGTALALHAWDDPVETLLRLAPDSGAQLRLPRLGEAFEPAHEWTLAPWWRGVDEHSGKKQRARVTRIPKQVPWPLD